ncbi:glycosyltransferase family 9 protein [Chitinophaga cymbidii]|uniref:Glycosyl transferase n=1 Tax=Chitinophaga cymbidii TaxID=1096750 RepID=A0A512RKJ1_9BACT|nr:glycosyltransferase family 9 protein [Chitinophaga cymbidii]GEP96192.1 hypothetical protein CCY01nite_24520 [Chitinophaga cymbidii]
MLAFERILCIRLDNIGDVVMSSPAIRALKETFQAHTTLLTSSMAAPVAGSIPEIDETIIFDVPWVQQPNSEHDLLQMAALLEEKRFDLAVIFTVYSQNPLPAAMLAYLAHIPIRLAYCRENPYQLLTHWIPEQEPYQFIRHQVRRDLDLVANIGADTTSETLSLSINEDRWQHIRELLLHYGADPFKPWIILHPGVSDAKRQYPLEEWIKTGRLLKEQLQLPLLITGNLQEREQAQELQEAIGDGCYNIAGELDIEDFIVLLRHSRLVISVNTGTVHLAAAMQTPVIVLYALTNPQHTPWKVPSSVLYFDVPEALRSRNEVVRYVYDLCKQEQYPLASPENILQQAKDLSQFAETLLN